MSQAQNGTTHTLGSGILQRSNMAYIKWPLHAAEEPVLKGERLKSWTCCKVSLIQLLIEMAIKRGGRGRNQALQNT